MVLESFLISLAANASYGISAEAVKKIVGWLRSNRPDLETAAEIAAQEQDFAKTGRVLDETIGVLVASASNGEIKIDGGVIKALREIKFDHQSGNVHIGNSVVSSRALVTGGSAGSTGQTTISGNTTLKSEGTSIKLGHGASIRMTGGASIKQN